MTDDFSNLKVIPLFASLNDDELAYVGKMVNSVTYPASQIIVQQGERGETFYIVVAGQVRVRRRDETGAEAIIRLLGTGQFFGEIGLLYDEVANATVETVSQTTLLYIQKDDFDAMVARLSGVRKQLEQAAGRRTKIAGLARYDWQLPDEIVLWMTQRNLIPLIFESIGGLVFWHFIAAVLAGVSFTGLPGINELPLGWQWGLRLVAFVVVSLVWVWYVYDWTNDYLVLTNQRIVHVERYGVLSETRKEIPIRAVQNVELSQKGPLSAVLGLADITVETIGGKITFTHISRAHFLQERILDQRTYVQQEARREEREAIRQELVKVLRPESLAQPPTPSPTPDAFAALARLKPKAPVRPSLSERLRSLRQMREEKDGEITWRKHWLFLIGRWAGPMLFAIAGTVAIVVAAALLRGSDVAWYVWTLVILFGILAPAFVWGWWEFLVWGGDIYTLTADRIIDIERLPLGLKELRLESGLDRIQDINVEVPNLVARIFGMGDVHIKTGAAGSDLTFYNVAEPYSVQRDIFHRLADLRRKEQEQRRRQTMEEMTKWLAVYNEMTTRPPIPTEAEQESSS